MPQVSSRVFCADWTSARFIDRTVILFVFGVLDHNVTVCGKQPAVARVPGRHDAIKHVDTPADAFHKVFRRSDAHQIAWTIRRQPGLDPVSYTHLRAHETPEHLVCR